jgi:hypothetical protein
MTVLRTKEDVGAIALRDGVSPARVSVGCEARPRAQEERITTRRVARTRHSAAFAAPAFRAPPAVAHTL